MCWRVTGDPAKVGDHPGASSVYDVNSLGLIKLLAGMNRGVNAVGRPLKGETRFHHRLRVQSQRAELRFAGAEARKQARRRARNTS